MDENVSDKELIRSRAQKSASYAPYGIHMKRRMVVITSILIIAVVVTGLSVFTPLGNNDDPNAQGINDYSALYQVIEGFHELSLLNQYDGLDMIKGGVMTPEMVDEANYESSVGSDYTSTNIQTEGMDEGDIVKTDGEQYIYKMSTKGCIIVRIDNGTMNVVSKIEMENYVPQEMYISGTKLILIGGIYEQYQYTGGAYEPMCDCMAYISYVYTDIRVYDIANINEPSLVREIKVDGYYNTSRLNTETNELIYIVNYYFSYGNQDDYVPEFSDSNTEGGEMEPVEASSIYFYDDVVNYSYLVIGRIDLDTPDVDPEQAAYLGLGGEIYVSSENIYVATYNYYSIMRINLLGWYEIDNNAMPETRIVKIGLDDLKQDAATNINGSILNRYSMDEYEGFLRIATTVYKATTYNMVYVLDSSLDVAGVIDNIATGERIYSVRFNGEAGSLVTFAQVDPYFNLDLSDPYHPSISEGLKEDGVSYYIHYIEGTDYTIGIGKNSEVVYEYGWERVVFKEIKVSLYDNSSGEAVNVATVLLPYESDNVYAYSELFYNPKAFSYNAERGLFFFTYEAWDYGNSYSSNYEMTQGLAVFRLDLDAQGSNKLIYDGTLSNVDNMEEYSYYYWYDYYYSFIERGVQIGDYIYTVSDNYIVSYELDGLNKLQTINVYEELAD
jgi:uncharacterized secreted protein with C-terminal beta-propeller domain